MNTYKLKKVYPGLPKDWEIGMEVGLGCRIYGYSPCNGKYTNWYINNDIIKNNPEFWEKVAEKDYEILSFKIPGNAHWFANLQHNGMYDGWSEDHALNQLSEGIWSINSVKRLSDSEVFTIGDNTKYGCIDEFYIKNNHLLATTVLESSGRYLKDLQKLKQPLFKTEDGKEIYEGDNTFGIDEKYQFLKFNGWVWKKNESPNKLHKHFSTKESAESYILLNKPCLSINDLKTQFNLIGDRSNNELALKELVKSKI
jgi:hypothetical protein